MRRDTDETKPLSISRRRVIQRMGLAAVAPAMLSLARPVLADDVPGPLILDTHQHLWDLTRFTLPWLEHAMPVYQHSYRAEEYIQATRGLNVKAVYMEVDLPANQRPAEADYVIDLCRSRKGPTVAAVIGGFPGTSGFGDYIARYQASGLIRGVRQVLHGSQPAGTCLADSFIRDIRLLGKHGLSFDLCLRVPELRDGLKLAELAPDTRLILDHCGNADPKAFMPKPPPGVEIGHDANAWKRDMEALAKRPNILCKISGIVARCPEQWSAEQLAPVVYHCLDTFGPDRVIFGGDWPVCLVRATLVQWIDALKQIVASRPIAEQRKLWSQNAVRYYSLGGLVH